MLEPLLKALSADWPGLDTDALRRELERHAVSPELLRELALSRACAQRNAAALAELDVLLREEVARAVRPLSAALVEEVTQLVRERLLVPDGAGRVRIAEYQGAGSLRAWLRVIAVRTALNLQRGPDEAPGRFVELGDDQLAVSDPELELFRARYREAFRASFAVALQTLSSRDRTVLKLHAIDGVALSRIGAMYRKDTSTVSRWMEQIRRALREATRAELARRLALSPSELDSVQRAADMEVSVSLARLLAE